MSLETTGYTLLPTGMYTKNSDQSGPYVFNGTAMTLAGTATGTGGGTTAVTLLSNAAATGTAHTWPGGTGKFTVVASVWNGATVTLQSLGPDGATWVPLGADTTLAANGTGVFECDAGQIRAAVSGGPPTAVYASANGVG